MEWLELLKILSDQQANEITQQQIDALASEVEALHTIRDLQNIVFSIAFGLLLAAVLVLDHLRGRQIKKLEASISRLNSIILQNRTLGTG